MPRIPEVRVPIPDKPVRFMHQLRAFIRSRNLSLATERAYCAWIKRYIKYYQFKHPRDLDHRHVEQFLHHLVVVDNVRKNTQKAALNSLAFLYNQFLQQPLGDLNITRSRRPRKLPVVLSHKEAMMIIESLDHPWRLITQLMYGSGLRVGEVVSLRVRDLDFDARLLRVSNGKGDKDRSTILPFELIDPLRQQILLVDQQLSTDLANGFGEVYVSAAAERLNLSARTELRWQYLFPSATLYFDHAARTARRHHVQDRTLQRKIKQVVKRRRILKDASCHTFRHSFATRLLEQGTNIRVVQELLGHASVSTTEIYTHVLNRKALSTQSPIDQ